MTAAEWVIPVVAYGRVLPEPTAAAAPRAAGLGEAGVKSTPPAWTWAAHMHRAFGIDVLECPRCGGRLRLIATLHDPSVIRKILGHLAPSYSGQSPGLAPSRARCRRVLIGSAQGGGRRRRPVGARWHSY